MFRTHMKSRSQQVTFTSSYRDTNCVGFVREGTYAVSEVEALYETIISDDEPQKIQKPVAHFKQENSLQAYSSTGVWMEGTCSHRTSVSNWHPGVIRLNVAAEQAIISSGLVPDWDALAQNHLNGPDSGSFSILNFMLEAGEIRDLFNRSSWATPSSATLALDFGVLPLIGDAQEIAKRLWTFTSNYEDLVSKLNRPKRAHRRVRSQVDLDPIPTTYGIVEFDRVTVTMVESATITPFWSGNQNLLALHYAFDQLGFNPSLGTLWNALPFSFIVDWFAPVGDHLQSGPWVQASSYAFQDACYSYKVQIEARARCFGFPYGIDMLGTPSTVAKIKATYYVRQKADPVLDGIDRPMPDWTLSPRNMRDLWALGAQLAPSVRKWSSRRRVPPPRRFIKRDMWEAVKNLYPSGSLLK
nr:MAG: maturation protein [Hangzhou steitz-like virus 5]